MHMKLVGRQFERGARMIFRGIAAGMLSVTFIALAAAAQEPLQFNVPYKCADGTQYVIEKCGPYGRFEICTWREEKNGQVITTANSERTQMYGRLKPCPVQAAAKPPAPGQPTTPGKSTPPGQAMNPPYMKEFPSVDRVMKEIQGSDPQDTMLRQTGAFRQLKQILQDTTGDRWYNNQLTPDETRIFGEYDVAYNNLGKQTDFPLGGYGTDRKFQEELFAKFSMTGVRAAYDKANAASLARHEQFVAANKPAPNPGTSQPAAPRGNPALINDPTAVATRRCLELGGAELECVGSGLLNGIIGVTGIDPGKITAPSRAGLRITGSYKDGNGIQLVFGDDSVVIFGCGKLIADGHGYTVGKIGSQLAIQIQNQPKAILLALGMDGKLVGPGAIDVTGRVIVGYHNVTMYKRYTKDNSIVPGSAYTERVPDYGPAIARCTIGPLPTAGSNSSAGNALMNVLDTLDPTKSDAEKARDDAKKATAPGPRLVGIYTSAGGLKLDFETDTVILDCAQAHARQKYSVENTPAQVLITVQNGTSPISLALQTNGSLSGPASVNVSGKLVTDVTDQGVQFAPTSATCAVGTMVSK
jgi:hypothetical protein